MKHNNNSSFTQTAAANMLGWYARNMPAELPSLVRQLEARARPMGLGQFEQMLGQWGGTPTTTTVAEPAPEDTRSWWQRGLSVIGKLGTTAITAVGVYKLEEYTNKLDQEAAVNEWESQLETQRRAAEQYQVRATTIEAQRMAAEESALLAKEQQAAKWRPFIMPGLLVLGGLGLWWFFGVIRRG